MPSRRLGRCSVGTASGLCPSLPVTLALGPPCLLGTPGRKRRSRSCCEHAAECRAPASSPGGGHSTCWQRPRLDVRWCLQPSEPLPAALSSDPPPWPLQRECCYQASKFCGQLERVGRAVTESTGDEWTSSADASLGIGLCVPLLEWRFLGLPVASPSVWVRASGQGRGGRAPVLHL